jgi:hypothetical protein
MATFITKFAADSVGSVAGWASDIKFMTAFVTKFSPFAILKTALWAFHFCLLHLTQFISHPALWRDEQLNGSTFSAMACLMGENLTDAGGL